MKNRLTAIHFTPLITKAIRLAICLLAILATMTSGPSSSFLVPTSFAQECKDQCYVRYGEVSKNCIEQCGGSPGCAGGCSISAITALRICDQLPDCGVASQVAPPPEPSNSPSPQAVVDGVRKVTEPKKLQ